MATFINRQFSILPSWCKVIVTGREDSDAASEKNKKNVTRVGDFIKWECFII